MFPTGGRGSGFSVRDGKGVGKGVRHDALCSIQSRVGDMVDTRRRAAQPLGHSLKYHFGVLSGQRRVLRPTLSRAPLDAGGSGEAVGAQGPLCAEAEARPKSQGGKKGVKGPTRRGGGWGARRRR